MTTLHECTEELNFEDDYTHLWAGSRLPIHPALQAIPDQPTKHLDEIQNFSPSNVDQRPCYDLTIEEFLAEQNAKKKPIPAPTVVQDTTVKNLHKLGKDKFGAEWHDPAALAVITNRARYSGDLPSTQSPLTTKKHNAVASRWAITVNRFLPNVVAAKLWHLTTVVHAIMDFLPLNVLLCVGKDPSGKMAARTLLGWLSTLFVLVIQNCFDSNYNKCGLKVLQSMNLYQKLKTQAIWIIRDKGLVRQMAVKFWFGKLEVSKMIAVQLKKLTHVNAAGLYNNQLKFLFPFYIGTRAGTLGPSCKEYESWGDFLKLRHVRLTQPKRNEYALELNPHDYKYSNNSALGRQQVINFWPVVNPDNVIFEVTTPFILFILSFDGFVTRYATIEEFLADARTFFEFKEEFLDTPLFPVQNNQNEFVEPRRPCDASAISSCVTAMCELAGLPTGSVGCFRRDMGNFIGKRLGSEVAKLFLNHASRDDLLFRNHYSKGTADYDVVKFRLEDGTVEEVDKSIYTRAAVQAFLKEILEEVSNKDNNDDSPSLRDERLEAAQEEAVANDPECIQLEESITIKLAEFRKCCTPECFLRYEGSTNKEELKMEAVQELNKIFTKACAGKKGAGLVVDKKEAELLVANLRTHFADRVKRRRKVKKQAKAAFIKAESESFKKPIVASVDLQDEALAKARQPLLSKSLTCLPAGSSALAIDDGQDDELFEDENNRTPSTQITYMPIPVDETAEIPDIESDATSVRIEWMTVLYRYIHLAKVLEKDYIAESDIYRCSICSVYGNVATFNIDHYKRHLAFKHSEWQHLTDEMRLPRSLQDPLTPQFVCPSCPDQLFHSVAYTQGHMVSNDCPDHKIYQRVYAQHAKGLEVYGKKTRVPSSGDAKSRRQRGLTFDQSLDLFRLSLLKDCAGDETLLGVAEGLADFLGEKFSEY